MNFVISATASDSESFHTKSRLYIAEVDDFYLSYVTMVGLNTVNEHFPVSKNQPAFANCTVAAKEPAGCECLPCKPPHACLAYLPYAPSPANMLEMSMAPQSIRHLSIQQVSLPAPATDGQ